MSALARTRLVVAAALAVAAVAACNQSPSTSAAGDDAGDDGPVVPWDGSVASCSVPGVATLDFGAPVCDGCMASQCCDPLGACLGADAGGECAAVLGCLVACARAELGDDGGGGAAEAGDGGADCESACIAPHTDDAGVLSPGAQTATAVLDCRDQSCGAAGCY